MTQRSINAITARLLLAGFVVSVVSALAACNTVKGFGEDVQGAAESTEEAIKGD
ncbi:MAG: Entericidin EcnA/B family protein [Phycisphaerales bacterium]|nr:Entericidin EcnA/B family protein [Phycisphaerae bacterium]NNF44799.1 Entericidin EcnA/B family protein [Phycisphaerales bacterium]NNM27135.1 Entericidin EcnA/B family protein [Phycisphaerales bacterium]